MARSYWPVSPKFWSDPKVLEWDDDTKLLALYLLTCPHRSMEGLFRLPRSYVLADLGWTQRRLSKAWDQLTDDDFIDYDLVTQVCLIPRALAYQAPQNDNQVTAAVRHLENLPASSLDERFTKIVDEQSPDRLGKRLPQRFGERSPDPPSPSPSPTPTRSPSPPRAAIERFSNGHKSAVDKSSSDDDPVERVFGAWIEATGKTGATRLDSKRRRLIKAALADYPPDDVIDAVRGWRQSPHHRGENERRTVFNDLGLLLRDSEHIEKFRDLARNAPAVKPATPEPAQWDAIRSATGEFG